MLSSNSKQFIKRLQQDAEDVKKLLITKRRPLIIEFCGTPKSGKTTIVEWLQKFLYRQGFKAEFLVERASISPLKKKGHVDFNLWVTMGTQMGILEATHTDLDILLVDRGIFDALCWTKWLERTGKISQEDANSHRNFFLLKKWRQSVDLVFVMKCSPEIALNRESKGLPFQHESATIMNPITLKQINDAVDLTVGDFKESFKNLEIIDTTNLNPTEGVIEIANKTINILKSFLDEKVLVVQKADVKKNAEIPDRGFINNPDSVKIFIESFKSKYYFIERSKIEKDDNYIQIIPCGLTQYQDKILLLRRKEIGDSLHDKYCLWAGGHVREEDKDNEDDIFSIIENGLRRELSEEIYIKNKYSIQPMGILTTNETKRASRHIGLLYMIILNTPDVALAIDQKEFRETSGKSQSGRLLSIDDIKKFYKDLGDWSKFMYNELCKNKEAPLFDKKV